MSEQKHFVERVEEFPPGTRRIVEINGRSIGVFNVNGNYVAILNLCPHEFAPVCLGRVSGTTLPSVPNEFTWGREGEILACPWHGWEFDLLNGECLTDRRRLHRFPVVIENAMVYIILKKTASKG